VAVGRSVAVLGPIPRDRITTHRGEVFEKYGCALYTVAALAALLDDDDRILPIVHVRRDDEEPIKQLLSAFPNVDLTGVRSEADHGAVVELTYTDQANRIETQIGFMDPITPADVEFALHADAFVRVPITDYEVGQATDLPQGHSDGTVLLDAHGPTSTLVIGGERKRRLWVERDSWLPHIDILKMNVEEAGCSWFLVCVTLDQRGCVAYHLDDSGALVEQEIPRIVVDNVVDSTGAGDSFAAGMAFGYMQSHDIARAAQYGNAMGAQRVSGSGLDVYRDRAETDEQIARTYGGPGE
jgi:sugar/nucleoside kinase (ribokinase family)